MGICRVLDKKRIHRTKEMTTKDKRRIIENWCDNFLPGMQGDDRIYAIISFKHDIMMGTLSFGTECHDTYENMIDEAYDLLVVVVWGIIINDISGSHWGGYLNGD